MSETRLPFKGSMLLRDQRQRSLGWTESLWVNKPSLHESLRALEEIAARRLALLPKDIGIQRLKVTDPTIPRATHENRHYNQVGKYATDGRQAGDFLSLTFQTGVFSTSYDLGGVPWDVADATGVHPTQEWQRCFDQFAEIVKRLCVMVNERQKEKVQILSITQAVGEMAKISMATDFFDDAHMAIKNGCLARIRLSKVEQQPSLNGSHSIRILDPRTAIISKNPWIESDITSGLIASTGAKTVNPIESVTILKMSHRKRGYGHSYPKRGRARNRPT